MNTITHREIDKPQRAVLLQGYRDFVALMDGAELTDQMLDNVTTGANAIKVRDAWLWTIVNREASIEDVRLMFRITGLAFSRQNTPGTACLAGMAMWALGRTDEADVWIGMALQVDSTHGLSLLVRQALDVGWPFAVFANLVQGDVDYRTCRRGL